MKILLMFTDWTQTEPSYFYARGVLCGVICTLIVISIIKRIVR